MRILLFTTLAMLLLAAYIISPFFALYRIDHAIQERDVLTLEQYADWPAIREQLRTDVSGIVSGTLADRSNSFLAKGLGELVTPIFVNRLVDSLVNPDGLISLVNQDDARESGKHLSDFITYAFFAGPMDFRVVMRNPNDADAPAMTALLEFEGLGWRVTRIRLPLVQLREALQKAFETAPLQYTGTVMEGLTDEQIAKLKAARDAAAMPVVTTAPPPAEPAKAAQH